MKKLINFLLILIMLFIPADAKDEFLSVYDEGALLSAPVEKYILTKNKLIFDKTEGRVVVATAISTGELSVTEYATKLYDELSVASLGRKNSVFLFICEESKDYHIIISESISAVLTGSMAQSFLADNMEEDFAKGDYDKAVIKTFNALADWYAEKYAFDADLTEDMSAYQDIIRIEKEEKQLKTILIVILVICTLAGSMWIAIWIRRKKRLTKLQKRRQERRKRYMAIK